MSVFFKYVPRLYMVARSIHTHTHTALGTKAFRLGQDSVVCIVPRYSLHGPGKESRWEREFPDSSIPVLWPSKSLVQ